MSTINRFYPGVKHMLVLSNSNLIQYAEEKLPPNELERALQTENTADEIFQLLITRLNSVLNDTASPDEQLQFIHCVECLSGTDILDWLREKSEMNHE